MPRPFYCLVHLFYSAALQDKDPEGPDAAKAHMHPHTHMHTHFNRVKNPTMYFPLIEYEVCTCMHNLQSRHKYKETYKHTLVSDPDKPLTARVKSLSLHDKVQEAGLLRLISLPRLQTALTNIIRVHSESF